MPLAKRLISIFTVFIFCCANFVSASDFTPFIAKVNSDNINIRSDATVSSTVICQVNKADTLEVLGESYDWYKIRLPQGAPSFIKKDLVDYTNENNAKVSKEKVNIRLKPTTSSAIIGRANKDEPIKIVETVEDWYRIEPVKNSFGWVHKQFLIRVQDSSDSSIIKAVQDKSVPLAAQETIKAEGTLFKYKKFFKPPADFKLVTKENKIFLLKSKVIDLKMYLDKDIKVAGNLSGAYQEIPIVEVESVITE